MIKHIVAVVICFSLTYRRLCPLNFLGVTRGEILLLLVQYLDQTKDCILIQNTSHHIAPIQWQVMSTYQLMVQHPSAAAALSLPSYRILHVPQDRIRKESTGCLRVLTAAKVLETLSVKIVHITKPLSSDGWLHSIPCCKPRKHLLGKYYVFPLPPVMRCVSHDTYLHTSRWSLSGTSASLVI